MGDAHENRYAFWIDATAAALPMSVMNSRRFN
jgi:hypothetical protein